MYFQRMVGLRLLVALVVLALSACGGSEPQANKPRPLPEDEKTLRPGEYHTEYFKPTFSFRVGKGWTTFPPEVPDALLLTWGETAVLFFANIQEVYKPTKTGTTTVVGAPEDMVVVALAGRRVDAPDAERPRFPLANVEAVEERLSALLADLNTSVIVCSAACGADLLALEAARRLGIRRRIVLPFEASRFRATSVVDRPGEWGSLFDSLYEEARSSNDLVIMHHEGDDEDAYAAATDRILTEAWALAKEDTNQEDTGSSNDRPTAVVVWEGASRGQGDMTGKFAALATEQGMRVVEVDTLSTSKGRIT
jgi:hypothetical protein